MLSKYAWLNAIRVGLVVHRSGPWVRLQVGLKVIAAVVLSKIAIAPTGIQSYDHC